mgnify:CR=1 FL=1
MGKLVSYFIRTISESSNVLRRISISIKNKEDILEAQRKENSKEKRNQMFHKGRKTEIGKR